MGATHQAITFWLNPLGPLLFYLKRKCFSAHAEADVFSTYLSMILNLPLGSLGQDLHNDITETFLESQGDTPYV